MNHAVAAPAASTEAAALAAIEQLITVPATTLPCGTVVPSFQVAQYMASKGADGRATSTADGAPWVEIDFHTAAATCRTSERQLLTELQALAIAFDIASVAANWTGGAVGEGKLKQGLRKGGPFDGAKPGSFVSKNADEDRWFVLSNGERICDAAGNIFTWVFDNVQGDANGLVAQAFAETSPSIATAPHPSLSKGMGWRPAAGRDWSGYALVRGGYWCSEDDAGVFRLLVGSPDCADDRVGFRYTKPSP